MAHSVTFPFWEEASIKGRAISDIEYTIYLSLLFSLNDKISRVLTLDNLP